MTRNADNGEGLLPCPFCGGDETSHGTDYQGEWRAVAQCHADGCGAYLVIDGCDEEAVIAAWNRRVPALPANGEAYQVIGAIASAGGLFDHPDVQRALDYFADPEGEILPFEVSAVMTRSPTTAPPGMEAREAGRNAPENNGEGVEPVAWRSFCKKWQSDAPWAVWQTEPTHLLGRDDYTVQPLYTRPLPDAGDRERKGERDD